MLKTLFHSLVFLSLSLALTSCKMNHSDVKDGFGDSDEVLRMACTDDPQTYDPRLARDLPTVTVLHMLYEGLMRISFRGKPEKALALQVDISPDLKTYTFELRKSIWANGDPVTAYDFVETWKSILDPQFPAPNAYQFFLIKNAKNCKEGTASFDQVGIKAPDDHTLVVELESPAPYFLDLVSSHFYYPTHRASTNENPITNGPFKPLNWKRNNRISMIKNPSYWDAKEVRLNGIVLLVLDEHTALRMYENGELDWVGSPLGTLPQDSIQSLKHQHKLMVAPAAGTHWFRFNTDKPPFNNLNMRKAFTLSIHRNDLVDFVTQGGQKPAEAIVPPSLGLETHSYFEDHEVPAAWYAFQEALEQMKISKDELPEISLCYATNDRNHKIAQAVQQQWKTALGIDVKLENLESKIFFDRLSRKDFQMANGSWYADIRDPINFLDVFKYKTNPTNNTQWENQKYITLLDKSNREAHPTKRFNLLNKAQGILMKEFPVAPLFFGSFNYIKDAGLLGVYFSDLGYLDFKYAFFSK